MTATGAESAIGKMVNYYRINLISQIAYWIKDISNFNTPEIFKMSNNRTEELW
jgi:hypothetical protein